jgi:hypothetical protein
MNSPRCATARKRRWRRDFLRRPRSFSNSQKFWIYDLRLTQPAAI